MAGVWFFAEPVTSSLFCIPSLICGFCVSVLHASLCVVFQCRSQPVLPVCACICTIALQLVQSPGVHGAIYLVSMCCALSVLLQIPPSRLLRLSSRGLDVPGWPVLLRHCEGRVTVRALVCWWWLSFVNLEGRWVVRVARGVLVVVVGVCPAARSFTLDVSGRAVCRATHLAITNSCISGILVCSIILANIVWLGYLRLRKVALSAATISDIESAIF